MNEQWTKLDMGGPSTWPPLDQPVTVVALHLDGTVMHPVAYLGVFHAHVEQPAGPPRLPHLTADIIRILDVRELLAAHPLGGATPGNTYWKTP